MDEISLSPKFMDDLLEALPYSKIPDKRDVLEVVNFFIEQGWTPPAENGAASPSGKLDSSKSVLGAGYHETILREK